MARPRTPLLEPRNNEFCHYPTPIKAKVQGTIEYLQSQGVTGKNEEVFRFFGVSHSKGYAMLDSDTNRRHHNQLDVAEHQRRKNIITKDQSKEMEHILETKGLHGRALTWEQLGFEANVKASGRTVQRTMGTMDYHKCIACKKEWVDPRITNRRLEFARRMLDSCPNKNDWKHIQFSDEVHFG